MSFEPSAHAIRAANDAAPDPLELTLSRIFGLPAFRLMQRDAIEAVMSGRDTLVVMPTGGGKSLCYQLPATLLSGVTLVVSPLIALMQDQVDKLRRLNINAVALNSSIPWNQIQAVIRSAQQGRMRMLFVSPERLESSQFREQLSSIPISLIAIDEAHCISEWGHDFRTSYRRIPEIFQIFDKRPPIIALTATATPEVRVDICTMLQLNAPVEIVTGFERTNIAYGVLRFDDRATDEKDRRLKDIVASVATGSTIVYASTRKEVERLSKQLTDFGIPAAAYHAGIALAARKVVQSAFVSGVRNRVLVATSAFGMGIDKADVRLVVHYDAPGSLEAYYQESGRAGRDGAPAHAVMFYAPSDIKLQEIMLRANAPTEAELKSVLTALWDIACVAIGNAAAGSITVTEQHILARIAKPQTSIERILSVLEQSKLIRLYRGGGSEHRARIQMTATRVRVEESVYKSRSPAVKAAANAILRLAGSEAFVKEVFVDHAALLKNAGLSASEFRDSARTLETLGLIKFTPPTRLPRSTSVWQLSLLGERQAIQYVDIGAKRVELLLEDSLDKLQQVSRYALEWACRRNAILRYFGERPATPICGRCDWCTARANGRSA
jgi:ATP-dependent DNA helicase RecQ